MTKADILSIASEKWRTPASRNILLQKYKCTPLYLHCILTGNKRMPGWMVTELGYEKVLEVTYRKRGAL